MIYRGPGGLLIYRRPIDTFTWQEGGGKPDRLGQVAQQLPGIQLGARFRVGDCDTGQDLGAQGAFTSLLHINNANRKQRNNLNPGILDKPRRIDREVLCCTERFPRRHRVAQAEPTALLQTNRSHVWLSLRQDIRQVSLYRFR